MAGFQRLALILGALVVLVFASMMPANAMLLGANCPAVSYSGSATTVYRSVNGFDGTCSGQSSQGSPHAPMNSTNMDWYHSTDGNNYVQFGSNYSSITLNGTPQFTDRFSVPNGATTFTFTYGGTAHSVTFDVTGSSIDPQTIVAPPPPNAPPVITGGPTAAVNVVENTTAVTNVDATDPDGETENGGGLVYSRSGPDGLLFSITASGELAFIAAPDFDAPGDSNGDNNYQVTVQVTDTNGTGLTDTQAITVTVTGVNETPTLAAPISGTVPEGTTTLVDIDATDPEGDTENGGGLTYSLSGPDQASFSIDAAGNWAFATAPDFDAPADADSNNVYEVTITVTDSGGLTDTQSITITVTNINEAPVITGGPTAAVNVVENTTAVTNVDATDPDGETENGGGLVYSRSGPDGLLFSITASGELAFIAAPDFDAPGDSNGDNNYQVTVQVTDTNGTGLTDTQAITVTVTSSDTQRPNLVIDAPASANGPYTATFTFDEPVNGFALNDILVGNGTASVLTGTDGDSVYTALITPTAHGEVTIDVAANVAQDLAGNNNIAAEQATTSFIDEEFVRTRTSSIITNFLGRRADQITAGDPDLARRLQSRNGGGDSVGGIGFTANGTLANNRMAFSTGLRKMMANSNANKISQRKKLMGLGYQELGRPIDENGFDVWMKGSWAHVDGDTSKSDIGQFFVGADYRFGSGLLIGVLTQFDWTDEQDDSQGFAADGAGWMVGPYVVAKLSENLIFDGRAAWGKSDNNVSPFNTFVDNFDTTRWLARATLTGRLEFGKVSLAPHIGIIRFEEQQNAYTDSLGVSILGQTVSLGRITFGSKISTTHRADDGTVISPYIGVKGIWDFDKAETLNLATGLAAGSSNDLRARLDGGVTLGLSNGWAFSGSGFYDGIGATDLKAYGGTVRLKVPLN